MLSKEKSIEKLNSLIERAEPLKKIKRDSAIHKKWIRDTQVALEKIFGNHSRHIRDFNEIQYSSNFYSNQTPEYEFQQQYVNGLENAQQILVSMIEEIQEYQEEENNQTVITGKIRVYAILSG